VLPLDSSHQDGSYGAIRLSLSFILIELVICVNAKKGAPPEFCNPGGAPMICLLEVRDREQRVVPLGRGHQDGLESALVEFLVSILSE